MPDKFFQKNARFFISFLLLGILLGVLLTIYPKPGVFLLFNGFHVVFLDYLFLVVTFLGDGWFVLAVAVILFFLKKRALSFLIISSYLVSGFVTQSIKSWFPEPRPAMYFQLHNIGYANFLDQVTLHNFYSFPSGHTTSAFALASSVAFLLRSKGWAPFLVVFAFIIGYSRIYLGQHFPEDVMAGMFIGVGFTTLCFAILGNLFLGWERKLNRSSLS